MNFVNARTLSVWLMWLLGLTNVAFLVWIVIDPVPVAQFVGIKPIHHDAGAELRAMYGGLIGGLGILNLLGALNPERLIPAVWSTAWAFAGVGVVRTISCLILGIGGAQALFAVLEVLGSCTCFILLRGLEQRH